MKIISATGQAQNGKDTFCDYLQKELNSMPNKIIWERTAFANAVKDTFCKTFDSINENVFRRSYFISSVCF